MEKFAFRMRDRLVATVAVSVLLACVVTILNQMWREKSHVDEIFMAQTKLIAGQARANVEERDARGLRGLFRDIARASENGTDYNTAFAFAAYDERGARIQDHSTIGGAGELTGPLSDVAKAALSQRDARALQAGDTFVVGVPVFSRETASVIGTVAVAWDPGAARASIYANAVSHTAVATVASLLFMLVVMIMLDRGLVGPLKRLQIHAAEIERSGEPHAIDDKYLLARNDEIGDLANAFNGMIEKTANSARQISTQSAEINRRNGQLDAALANMSRGLCMYDADGRLVLANAQFSRIYGVPEDALRVGATFWEILETLAEHGRLTEDQARKIVADHEFALRRKASVNSLQKLNDGRSISISQATMKNGGWVATYEDISERVAAENQIAHMAHHDALTELPNRVLFRETLKKDLSRVKRGELLAVHCLDLDHFKAVNDTLGHPIGDQLLCAVAQRLQSCLREHDTVSRLGGDEFAIVQTRINSSKDASSLANRVVKALCEPFQISGHQVVIGVSVGIAVSPSDGNEADHLLKCADMALYRAKADGRGTHRYFEPDMDARMQQRRGLELDLREALVENQFEVHFQPLIDMASRKIGGFEALLRWRHPARGMVSPGDFIPLAEEIGLINEIGLWVLRESTARAALWPDAIKISVNISAVQFRNKTLVEDIVEALEKSGLDPCRLELEITESVVLTDTEQTLSMLHRLRGMGVSIAMDDFGTGYSSLSCLQRFPFDRIKIDRSFICDLQTRPNTLSLIKAIADVGRSLDIETTAEGVENAEQLEMLEGSGCSVAQGFYFSRAVPAESVAGLIERFNHRAVEKAA